MASKKNRQPGADDFDFDSIHESARKAVCNALLKEWHFDEYPSADLLVTAVERSSNQTAIDDHVKENYPPAVYERFHETGEAWLKIGSGLFAPLQRMMHWATKLGLCKATDNLDTVFAATNLHMIAVHRWHDHQCKHADLGIIADILEKDATAIVDPADTINEYRPPKFGDAYCVIQFLHQHRAFDKSSLCRTEDIAAGMTGRSTDQNSYKHAVAKLSAKGIVGTAEGRRGGVWLTDKGKRLAADIFSPETVR